MTGIAHNADIMAIRMGDVFGNSFVNAGDLAQAIRYAVDNGADVINMSLGWGDPTGSVRDALAYAASRDVIAVIAAGNNSLSAPASPAHYATDYGISVGAVDRFGNITDFSNRAGSDRQMHHVMAPGEAIYSTMPNNRYDYSRGTSMAAPHVAGVIALMLSANPNLTHDQVREMLIGTADLNTASASHSGTNSAGLTKASNSLTPVIWENLETDTVTFEPRENGPSSKVAERMQSKPEQDPVMQIVMPEVAIADSAKPMMESRRDLDPYSRDQRLRDDWLTSQQSLLKDDLIGSLTA
jgi:subtilisin family serine protease